MSAEPPFVYRLRVRFAECDPQKVAFNGVYGLYIDLAVFEFMRAMGFGESLVKGPLDYQVVKQSVEWTGPARFDQIVEISIWAKHLGNTSFTIATQFRIAGDHKVSATGETIYVLVDAKTLTKTPLPAEFRAALARRAVARRLHAASAAHARTLTDAVRSPHVPDCPCGGRLPLLAPLPLAGSLQKHCPAQQLGRLHKKSGSGCELSR